MINTLVFPLNYFQTLLHLLASEPKGIVYCIVGSSHLESETRYLVRRVESAHTLLSDRDRESSICVSMAVDAVQPDEFRPQPLPLSGTLGHFIIGRKALQGQWWGEINGSSGTKTQLDRILLVGAGMHELKASNSGGRLRGSDSHDSRMQRTMVGEKKWFTPNLEYDSCRCRHSTAWRFDCRAGEKQQLDTTGI